MVRILAMYLPGPSVFETEKNPRSLGHGKIQIMGHDPVKLFVVRTAKIFQAGQTNQCGVVNATTRLLQNHKQNAMSF